jgi:hypothetical protein
MFYIYQSFAIGIPIETQQAAGNYKKKDAKEEQLKYDVSLLDWSLLATLSLSCSVR